MGLRRHSASRPVAGEHRVRGEGLSERSPGGFSLLAGQETSTTTLLAVVDEKPVAGKKLVQAGSELGGPLVQASF